MLNPHKAANKRLQLDFHGAAEHSEAMTRELLNMGEPLAAHTGIQRGRTLGRDYFRGSVQYRLRRALGHRAATR